VWLQDADARRWCGLLLPLVALAPAAALGADLKKLRVEGRVDDARTDLWLTVIDLRSVPVMLFGGDPACETTWRCLEFFGSLRAISVRAWAATSRPAAIMTFCNAF
jgi:hypothetical protein